MEEMQEIQVVVSKKVELPQNLFSWTADDSIAETKNNTIRMKADLDKLIRDEFERREIHDNSKGNLQEAWDKLGQLRCHISLFKSAIEEAITEDVFLQVGGGNHEYVDLNTACSRLLLSTESARKLEDTRGIREKIRLKDTLQKKVGIIERELSDLRIKLSHFSLELTRFNNNSDSQTVSKSIEASMIMRQAVISNSEQLEGTERYIIHFPLFSSSLIYFMFWIDPDSSGLILSFLSSQNMLGL